MTALTFGYFLLGAIVLAFAVNFFNFQSRTARQLKEYELEKGTLTKHLKQEQREREKEQALIHKQTHVIADAEERIRLLEQKLSDLEDVAFRLESLVERFNRLDEGGESIG